MSDRIAIVMATFNGSRWIEDQLASIRAQSHTRWHLFVRDDGSQDGSLQAIREGVPPDHVTFLDEGGTPSGSPAGNFLKALCMIDLQAFDFVAFADQDDVWSPDKLSRALERMRATGAHGYSSDLIAFNNETHRAWYLKKSEPQRAFDYLFQGASAGCTYLLSRQAAMLVAEKVGPFMDPFPTRRSHDWLVYAICRSYGLTWVFDDSAHIFYRQHASNAFGALPNVAGLLARLRLSRDRWYRDHVVWLGGFLQMSEAESEILEAVRRLSWKDRLVLACRSRCLRRSRRDRWLLAVAILTGSF
jgi:rhamnosyltransferase